MLVLWVYAAQPQLTEQVPERVFNFDESQFLLAKKKGTVLGPVNCKSFLQVSCKENDKEGLTVLTGYSANGSLAPPKTVYSYKQSIPYDCVKDQLLSKKTSDHESAILTDNQPSLHYVMPQFIEKHIDDENITLFKSAYGGAWVSNIQDTTLYIYWSSWKSVIDQYLVDGTDGGPSVDGTVAQGTTVFKLFASEDESLLVWWNAFLVLDLGLHIVDGVTWFNLQGDGPR
ncbi:hypothetical protein EMCRGX_G020835 [Ephydatia muelleri]